MADPIIGLYAMRGAEEEAQMLSSSAIHDDVIFFAMPVRDSECDRIECRHPRVLSLPRLSRRGNAAQQFREQAGKGRGDVGLRVAPEDCEGSSNTALRNKSDRNEMTLRFVLQCGERAMQMGIPVASLPSFLFQQDEIGRECIKQLSNALLCHFLLPFPDRRIHSLAPFEEGPMPLKYRIPKTPMPEIERKHDRIVDSEFHGRR